MVGVFPRALLQGNINYKKDKNMETSIACRVMSNVAVINGMDAVRASVIAHRTGNRELGMVKAMMIENLKTKLMNGVAHFVFVKKSGELREMWATCVPALVKAKTNGRGESRENYATTAVFDIEKGEWRSFRWETLIQVF